MTSEQLLELRKQTGLTQEEFGSLLDTTRRTLCAYETGERRIPHWAINASRAIKFMHAKGVLCEYIETTK